MLFASDIFKPDVEETLSHAERPSSLKDIEYVLAPAFLARCAPQECEIHVFLIGLTHNVCPSHNVFSEMSFDRDVEYFKHVSQLGLFSFFVSYLSVNKI